MKVVTILGSPRNNGNTNKALNAVIDGVKTITSDVEQIKLGELGLIKHCTNCDGCKNNSRICILKDELIPVINKVREADSIVIGAPIYYFGLNSLTKAFIDRTFYSSVDKDNQFNLLIKKKFGLILTYGDDDVIESGGINAISNFKDIGKYVGFKIEGIIYGTGNEISGLSKKELDLCTKLGKDISK
jgi:multimeric flavodoxin WrbA